MANFPAIFQPATLDGQIGFRFGGETGGDIAGYSVASAGDVNGDGYDDFIVGAPGADPNGSRSGASYVVFGKANGFPADFNLSTLDGTNGFKLSGVAAYGESGRSVASAGDVNNDGFDDLIIGARYATGTVFRSGVSYVVFGKASGFSANLDLSTLDGTSGFRISGAAADDFTGRSVASAGDVNGDGYGDLIIGAYRADPNGSGNAGASYVVFGMASGFASNLDLATLDGTTGFKISGVGDNIQSGISVASAGDVNHDGYDDLIIAANRATGDDIRSGAAYVVFGKASGFASNLDLTALDGTNGFKISGLVRDDDLRSVASAGDVNGDGYDDLIIGDSYGYVNGAHTGAAYVVFGKASGFAANISLASLNGSNGFRLSGGANGGQIGYSVASAGDVNGDSYDDVIVGARFATSNGGVAGITYVVFGKASGFSANVDLASLTGANGFQIHGANAGDLSGWSVASAGDVNHDGYDDLIVGAPGADPNGSSSGGGYIIFGHATPPAPVVDTGTSGDDTQNGGAASDSLSGGGGNDTLNGLAGNDTLNGGDGNDIINGGTGADAMTGGVGDDTFYVDDVGDTTIEAGGEGFDLVRATLSWILGANLEALTLEGSANIDGTGNSLDNTITGNDGDNSLSGGAGKDILYGGIGADTLDGGSEGDWLDGGTGADNMSGGTGDDTYVVDDAGDVTTESGGEGNDVVVARISWTLGANIERLILDTGYGDINGTGNAQANTMVGNEGANTLDGGDGEDIIKGGAGDDTLLGGNGADMLYGGDGIDDVDGQGGNDILSGGAGDDFIFGGVGNDNLDGGADNDTLDGGTGNDQLQGGAGTDSLTGGDGNDVLDGGTGADAMLGGLGDDIYYVDNIGDTTVEAPGEGIDLVRATINWILSANTENLVLDGSGNIDGTGNSVANAITGNSGNNVLDGGAGDDVLKGGNGNDVLIGGAGSDILVGGAGADTFKVTEASVRQSHLGGTLEVDTVNDLILAQGDKLDLSAIDADSTTAGDQAFTLVSNFTHHAGEMTLSFAAGITVLTLDVDGDGTADYRMKISGDVHLDSGGWVL